MMETHVCKGGAGMVAAGSTTAGAGLQQGEYVAKIDRQSLKCGRKRITMARKYHLFWNGGNVPDANGCTCRARVQRSARPVLPSKRLNIPSRYGDKLNEATQSRGPACLSAHSTQTVCHWGGLGLKGLGSRQKQQAGNQWRAAKHVHFLPLAN